MKRKLFNLKIVFTLFIVCLLSAWYFNSEYFQSDIRSATPDLSNVNKSLNFIVVGDWGKHGSHSQRLVANQMGQYAEKYHSDFVISTGDNFYMRGVQSVNDPQWQQTYENVYSEPSLQIPWYVCLGNHDYMGSLDAEINYTKQSDRWYLPERYYSVEKKISNHHLAQFVFLDTNTFVTDYYSNKGFKRNLKGKDFHKQVEWLDKTLGESNADWKFVIGHHPIYSGGKKYGDTPELIKYVEPILKKYHVQAYICGHEHNLQCLYKDGIYFFISGGGGKPRKAGLKDTLFSKGTCGFLTLSLTDNNMTACFFNNKGKQLYSTEFSK